MRLLLKPISNSQLDDIVVESSLFAIGRREEPFLNASEDARKLSRRHARIFLEGGQAYLADLGSLNGTRVNGNVLGNDARVLADGDIVEFGGAFSFKARVERTAEDDERDLSSLRMILAPVTENEFENIVVERFPFMINRDDSMFSQFKSHYPEDVLRISRRHALFVAKGDEIHLEDLDSSNGTFVNGEKLDEHCRPLVEGDVVMFGGRKFSYTVHLQTKDLTQDNDATVIFSSPAEGDEQEIDPDRTVLPPDLQDAIEPPIPNSGDATPVAAASDQSVKAAPTIAPVVDGADKTRFVESATSFLDVFCGPPAESIGLQSDPEQDAVPEAARPKPASELARSFALGQYSRIGVIFGGAVLVLVAVAGTTYWLGSDVRQMKALLDEGRYMESVAVARTYLESNADDFDAIRLGEEALMRSVIPTWSEHISQSDFQRADLYLADIRSTAGAIGRGTQMLDLLSWVGRAQQLMASRGNAVSVTADTLAVQSLVAEWDADQYKHRQLMAQMQGYEPTFEPIAADAMSDLVQLRNSDATYGRAIEKLKNSIANGLVNGQLNSVEKALNAFAADYTTVTGIDLYRQDLARLTAMRERYERNDLFELANMAGQGDMQTATFATYVSDWLEHTVPSASLIAAYEQASEQWRAGNAVDAVGTLESVSGGEMSDLVQAKIDRYRQIDRLYKNWSGAGTADQLLALREQLSAPQDEYYLQATESAFKGQRHLVAEQLKATFSRSSASWESYIQAGGIPGLMRLDSEISEDFRSQCERLSTALAEIRRGNKQQAMLEIEASEEWSSLELKILNEIRRQRLWLRELGLVMDMQRLAAKLALLPDLKE